MAWHIRCDPMGRGGKIISGLGNDLSWRWPALVVYTAGDNGDICNSLACFGGTSGPCTQHEGVWAFREVHCAPSSPPGVRAAASNIVIADSPEAGVWGGTCTCPDGSIYMVRAIPSHFVPRTTVHRPHPPHPHPHPLHPHPLHTHTTTTPLLRPSARPCPCLHPCPQPRILPLSPYRITFHTPIPTETPPARVILSYANSYPPPHTPDPVSTPSHALAAILGHTPSCAALRWGTILEGVIFRPILLASAGVSQVGA